MINTMGIITTIAGTGEGEEGPDGDGGLAVEADITNTRGAAADPEGNIYIADLYGHRIRKVGPPAILSDLVESGDFFFPDTDGLGYVMDSTGRHQKTIDLASGTILSAFSYSTVGDQERLSTITDQFGNTITIEYSSDTQAVIVSPDGIRTTLTMDSDGQLKYVTFPDGTYYEFEYLEGGLLFAKIDPNRNRFEHYYDETGRVYQVSDQEEGIWNFDRAVTAENQIQYTKSTAEGRITGYFDSHNTSGEYNSVITDPNGAETRYRESADGMSREKTLSCGTQIATIFGLDPTYKNKYVKQSSTETPSGLTRTVVREREHNDLNEDDIPDQIIETTQINGRPWTVTQNVLQSQFVMMSPTGRSTVVNYDPATLRPTTMSIPGLLDVEMDYDTKGRLKTVTSGTRSTEYNYYADGSPFAGSLYSVTDGESHTTYFDTYDLLGRLKGVLRPDSSRVDYAYDAHGNLDVLTTPRQVDHDFDYNHVNLTSYYHAPLSGSYHYLYNRDRDLTEIQFPTGRQMIHTYISGSTLVDYTTMPHGVVDYAYYACGLLDTVTMGDEAIDYDYDGQLVTGTTYSGTLNQSVSYSYYDDFSLESITYAGETVSLGYDQDDLLTTAGAFTISRNSQNGLPEAVYDTTVNMGRSFNDYGEIDGQTVTAGGQTLSDWSLTHYDDGRIKTKTETVAGETHGYVYTYDGVGRLRTVTLDGTLVEDYQYYADGTRQTESNTLRGIADRGFTYSDEDYLLTAGDQVYTYDFDGFLNTKSNGSDLTTYTYSIRGELLQVELPDGRVVTYTHDPLGRRIAKKIDGAIVEKYLWQGLTRLLAVYDGSDNLVQRFEYADGRLPVAMTMSGSRYYLTYDQVGSLRVVADSSGNVVKKIDYDTFGNIVADSSLTFTIPFGFAGGLHDRDTGLVRFGYRDYDPDTGRWTAKDPIGFNGGGTDLYGYCLNDPVNLIDSEGKFFNLAAAGIGAVVGGVINAAYAYSKGESALKGFAVGAFAGALSGLTLNPFLVGAVVGAANSTGNIVAGIDNPCNPVKAIAVGALTGAIAGGIGGTAGEAMAPTAPEIGAAAGEAAGASLANALQGFIQFWRGF